MALIHPSIETIYTIGRRSSKLNNPKLVELIIDYDNLDSTANFWDVDAVFCCLGTTIKRAGSQEKFKQVDYNYVKEIAQHSFDNGAKQFHVVTAMGANSKSRIFYNKVKGEIEKTIEAFNFSQSFIYRPSLLLGPRKGFRLGENIAQKVFSTIGIFMKGPLQKYRAIEAHEVARAMLNASLKDWPGLHVLESDDISHLAEA